MQTKCAVPLLLFAGSCATARPPSVDFLARAESIPPSQSLLLPSSQRAFAAWQLPPDDPWVRFNKWTLLSSLGDQVSAGELPDVRLLGWCSVRNNWGRDWRRQDSQPIRCGLWISVVPQRWHLATR